MTPFERFEARMMLRGLLVFFGGGAIYALYIKFIVPLTMSAPQGIRLMIVLIPLSIWLIASVYTISRMRGRHEAVAAYKRRVNYKEE